MSFRVRDDQLGSDAEVSANERLVDAVLERDGCFALARERGPRRCGVVARVLVDDALGETEKHVGGTF